MTDLLDELRAHGADLDAAIDPPTADRIKGAGFVDESREEHPSSVGLLRPLSVAAALVLLVGALVWQLVPRGDVAPVGTIESPAPARPVPTAPDDESVAGDPATLVAVEEARYSGPHPLGDADRVVVRGDLLFSWLSTSEALELDATDVAADAEASQSNWLAWSSDGGTWKSAALVGVDGEIRSVAVGAASGEIPVEYVSTSAGVWRNDGDTFERVDFGETGPQVILADLTARVVAFDASPRPRIWSMDGDTATLLRPPPDGVEWLGSTDGAIYSFGISPQPGMFWWSMDGSTWSGGRAPVGSGPEGFSFSGFLAGESPVVYERRDGETVVWVAEDGRVFTEVGRFDEDLESGLGRIGDLWVLEASVDDPDADPESYIGTRHQVLLSSDLETWHELDLGALEIVTEPPGAGQAGTFHLDDRMGFYLLDQQSGQFDVWVWSLRQP